MRTSSAFVVLLILVFFAGTSFAQRGNFVEQKVQKLKTDLNLTDEQATEVTTILTNSENEAKKVRQLNQGDPEAIGAAMKDLQDRTNQQIENILTPDQQKKYQTIKNRIGAPGEMNNRELSELRERLKLTDEQAAKIEPIMASAREQMQQLRQNRPEDRHEMREKMRAIFEERDKKVEEILTGSQKKEYEKYLQERREQMMQRRGPRGGGEGQRPF